ncbi:MAG: TRL-like family protein [Leptospiraceae bacterium]|nr:TRL-like family protein [Leptospiraceae bacterium]MCB1321457.1 TRL-like family protein [Leptospiraceae bacterium]
MKKHSYFVALIMVAALSMACASNSVGVGGPDLNGILYYNVTHSESIASRHGAREGESCQSSYLNLVASGDASVRAAAAAGSINQINSIDFKRSGVLLGSLFAQNCTIVTGN